MMARGKRILALYDRVIAGAPITPAEFRDAQYTRPGGLSSYGYAMDRHTPMWGVGDTSDIETRVRRQALVLEFAVARAIGRDAQTVDSFRIDAGLPADVDPQPRIDFAAAMLRHSGQLDWISAADVITLPIFAGAIVRVQWDDDHWYAILPPRISVRDADEMRRQFRGSHPGSESADLPIIIYPTDAAVAQLIHPLAEAEKLAVMGECRSPRAVVSRRAGLKEAMAKLAEFIEREPRHPYREAAESALAAIQGSLAALGAVSILSR